MKKLFPNEKIAIGDHFRVEQDWETPIPGFFIIAAKRKMKSVSEFTPEEEKEFIELLCKTRRGMKEALRIKEVCLFQNEGSAFDFHVWMLPRYGWMDRFGRGTASLIPILRHAKESMKDEKTMEQVREHANRVREYMKRQFSGEANANQKTRRGTKDNISGCKVHD